MHFSYRTTTPTIHQLEVEPRFERKELQYLEVHNERGEEVEFYPREECVGVMTGHHVAFARPWHQYLTRLGYLLLVLACWSPVRSCSPGRAAPAVPAVGGILQDDSTAASSHHGRRSEDEKLAEAEVVGDLEIFTHAEETAKHVHSDASLPHGRQVRVRNAWKLRAYVAQQREGSKRPCRHFLLCRFGVVQSECQQNVSHYVVASGQKVHEG